MNSRVDSVAVITGGTSGIGWKTAELLLESRPDAACALVDVNEGQSGELIERFGQDRIRFVQSDVTDPAAVNAAAAEIEHWNQPINMLVTCAGIHIVGDSFEYPSEHWREVLSVHVNGTFFWCQAAGRAMREAGGGAIVTVGSVAQDFGFPGRAAYTTSKAGIAGLTRVLAVEWAPARIRVNQVIPGMVETPMLQRTAAQGIVDLEAATAEHPLGRLGATGDLAEAIVFLLSEQASFITGAQVHVDGGFRAQRLA
ncbi:MAG: SDR family oxidoreductase [bacterium]|nr:SDR family oxidoreductase [bacterium]MDE0601394.1 SDR family oxidoreductase [bacterium]